MRGEISANQRPCKMSNVAEEYDSIGASITADFGLVSSFLSREAGVARRVVGG